MNTLRPLALPTALNIDMELLPFVLQQEVSCVKDFNSVAVSNRKRILADNILVINPMNFSIQEKKL